MFDWKKPTVQMLGRWQPWHYGHQALFKRCVAKTEYTRITILVPKLFAPSKKRYEKRRKYVMFLIFAEKHGTS